MSSTMCWRSHTASLSRSQTRRCHCNPNQRLSYEPGGHIGSENQLHLRPHASNAAVGEIPIQKAERWGADHAGRRNLSELRVIQGIEGFPSKLHPFLLSDREGLCKGYIKVVDTARKECVPANRGSIGESNALNPVNVSGVNARTGVRIPIAGRTELRAGRRRHDGAAVERRARIADVGAVAQYGVIVAVEAVCNRERGTGLKRCDAGKRPPAESVLPQAGGRTGDIPYIGDSEPVGAVIIAWPTIEFKPALHHRYRRPVARLGLVVGGSDSLAGTVNVPRPRVRGIGLEAASK